MLWHNEALSNPRVHDASFLVERRCRGSSVRCATARVNSALRTQASARVPPGTTCSQTNTRAMDKSECLSLVRSIVLERVHLRALPAPLRYNLRLHARRLSASHGRISGYVPPAPFTLRDCCPPLTNHDTVSNTRTIVRAVEVLAPPP